MKKILTILTTFLLLTTIIYSLRTNAQESDSDPKYDARIEIIDPNNVPSYIQDYLKCPTKFLKNHYDLFLIKEDGSTEYQCPPTLKEKGCSVNVFFNVTPKGQKMNNIVEEDGKSVILNDKNHPRDENNRVPFGWNCDIWNAYYGGEGGGCASQVIVSDGRYVQEHIGAISSMSDAKSNEIFGEYKGFKCLQIPLSLLSKSDLATLKQLNPDYKEEATQPVVKSSLSIPEAISSSTQKAETTVKSSTTVSTNSKSTESSSKAQSSISNSQSSVIKSISSENINPKQGDKQQDNNLTFVAILITILVLGGSIIYFINKSKQSNK
jgi:hypothetical protein